MKLYACIGLNPIIGSDDVFLFFSLFIHANKAEQTATNTTFLSKTDSLQDRKGEIIRKARRLANQTKEEEKHKNQERRKLGVSLDNEFNLSRHQITVHNRGVSSRQKPCLGESGSDSPVPFAPSNTRPALSVEALRPRPHSLIINARKTFQRAFSRYRGFLFQKRQDDR